jgi:hypothetical protein
MQEYVVLAQPWWVNLLIFVPFGAYYSWKDKGLALPISKFILASLFGIAFGFVEAAVVVYLRAAVGLLPGYGGTLADVANLSAEIYQRAGNLGKLPRSLLTVEVIREAATMFMLLSVTFLAMRSSRERWAIFLWIFATWDIVYYASLWATVRWPSSFLNSDVLFLIPVPWVAQVWFPILVSALTITAIVLASTSGQKR